MTVDGVDPPDWSVDQPPSVLIISGKGFYPAIKSNVVDPDRLDIQQSFEVRWHRAYRPDDPVARHKAVRTDNENVTVDKPVLVPGIYELEVVRPDGVSAPYSEQVVVREMAQLKSVTAAATIPGDSVIIEAVLDPPIDPAHTLLLYNFTHASLDPNTGMVGGWLADNGAAVTFRRAATVSKVTGEELHDVVDIQYTLLTIPEMKVERGSIDATDVELDFGANLLRPVDSSRSIVLANHDASGQVFSQDNFLHTELTASGTAILVTCHLNACGETVFWQVAEFPSEATVTTGSVSLPIGQDSVSFPLPLPVATDHSVLLVDYTVDREATPSLVSALVVRGRFADAGGTIVFDRGPRGASFNPDYDTNVVLSWQILTWPRISAQHGDVSIPAGDLSVDVHLPTPVDSDKAVSFLPSLLRQGRATYDDDDLVGLAWFTTSLDSSGSVLTLTRGADLVAADASWTVVEIQ